MALDYCHEEIWVDAGNGRQKRIQNPHYIPNCNRSKLIQRLNSPRNKHAFSFGGGLPRGGFTEEAYSAIRELCSFDYMGASEFECGAVPKAIKHMLETEDLEAYTLDVCGYAEFPWEKPFTTYDYDAREKIRTSHVLNATVFVIAPPFIRLHVENIIISLAMGVDCRLKEPTHIERALFEAKHWNEREWAQSKAQGWLELDNGYMFFVDEDMWRNFQNAFGMTPPDPTSYTVVTPDFSAIETALKNCPVRT